VDLSQRRLTVRPFLVAFAEPRISKAVGVGVAVLLPQQRKRHAGTTELAVDRRPIGPWTLVAGQIRWWRIEPSSGGNG
jgi:hypothetical protein